MILIRNKRGMYEYILTKSVMIVFILGLVGIFISFYGNLNKDSAYEIATFEAERIAKIIDDAVGVKGVSNTAKITLKRQLAIGAEDVMYTFEINKDGVILVRPDQYPFQDIDGVAQFGLRVEYIRGSGSIQCDSIELMNGATLTVEKTEEWKYNTDKETLYYTVNIKIDAPECLDYMEFGQEFAENGSIVG